MLTCIVFQFRSREYAVWDARNMEKPFKKTTLDTSSGIMLPLYDQDTETMYLVSRGDATIHTIQFSDLATTPSLAENQPCGTSASIYGATLLPKKSLRVMETEIARILAVVDNGVMPVSYHVPRKVNQWNGQVAWNNLVPISNILISTLICSLTQMVMVSYIFM